MNLRLLAREAIMRRGDGELSDRPVIWRASSFPRGGPRAHRTRADARGMTLEVNE
jgi:hypothetical protein